MSTKKIDTPQSMRLFGRQLANKLKAGQVVSLEGPLGAGKTTLMQGIVEGLGITKKITSPTFVLFRVLPLKKTQRGIKWLVHGDAYRLKKPQEMIQAGLNDYLADPQTVTVIEWGDKLKKILPPRTLHIKIKTTQDPLDHGRIIDYPEVLS